MAMNIRYCSRLQGIYGQSSTYTWALPNNSYTTGTYFCRYLSSSATSTLTATIKVDELSTFLYELNGSDTDCRLTVYVDGVQKRTIRGSALSINKNYAGSYNRFFEVLAPGIHTISWEFQSTANSSCNVYVRNIACKKTPEISVNLLEPGSLGTEVLYGGVNHIKDVRKLKVKGPMNSDDWAQIQMMDSLFELDLGEAEVSLIPAQQFDGNVSEAACQYLHKIVMPKTLQSIGNNAFVTYPHRRCDISGRM